MNRLLLGRLVFLFLLIPGSAFSATYYTATTGSNNNTCAQAQSESTPKRTVAAGVSCLNSSDTLIVKAGTYIGPSNYIANVPSGSSWSNTTTLRSYPGDTVTIQASSPYSSNNRVVYLASGRFIEIDGFILDGNNRAAHDVVKIDGSASHIRIQNCEIKFSFNQGMLLSGSDYNEILNNDIHDNGDPSQGNQVHGLYLSNSKNNTIWGNDFYRNQAYGLQLWYTDNSSNNNNDIQYNRSFDNKIRAGMTIKGSGNLIANNLTWDNASPGGIVVNGGSTNKVYNNTSYSNTDFGIHVASGSAGTLVRNNISFSNSATQINDAGSSTTRSNNIVTDPLFENAAADNFRIREGSAARDAGMTLPEAVVDFDKIPRPQGAGVDIGAFEYVDQSGPSSAESVPMPPATLAAE